MGSLNNNSLTLSSLNNNKASWGLMRPQMTLFLLTYGQIWCISTKIGFPKRLPPPRRWYNVAKQHFGFWFFAPPKAAPAKFLPEHPILANLGLNNSWTTLTNNKGSNTWTMLRAGLNTKVTLWPKPNVRELYRKGVSRCSSSLLLYKKVHFEGKTIKSSEYHFPIPHTIPLRKNQ